MASRVPLRRFGTLADCAALALFLASPLASWTTGALDPVDSGKALYGASFSSTQMALDAGTGAAVDSYVP